MANVTQVLTLEDVRAHCVAITTEAIASVGQKYDGRRYVTRQAAERCYERFRISDRKVFLLLGDSGKGKTNVMARLAQSQCGQDLVLFLSGLWRMNSYQGIIEYVFDRLKTDVGHQGVDTWQFLRLLTDVLTAGKSQLFVVIDAINETTDRSWAKAGLRDLLTRTPGSIRFVLSCRTDSFRLDFEDSFWKDFVFHGKTSSFRNPKRPNMPRKCSWMQL